MKEIRKIRGKINNVKDKKKLEKINKTKHWLF